MLPQSLLVLLSATLATAKPLRRSCSDFPAPTNISGSIPGTDPRDSSSSSPTPSPTPSPSPTSSDESSFGSPATPLPSTGGSSELPAPAADSPKYMAVGHGIQNYTCSGVASGGAATAKGALAMLYDISSIYPTSGSEDAYSETEFDAMTSYVLRGTDLPLNMAGSPEYAADATSPFPSDQDLTLPSSGNSKKRGHHGRDTSVTLPFLGHHYFDASAVPTFDLYAASTPELMKGAVNTKVNAPSSADPGITNSGAVQWLYLTSTTGTEGDVTVAYRVLTAGGNAAACASEDQNESVPYSAQYWFY